MRAVLRMLALAALCAALAPSAGARRPKRKNMKRPAMKARCSACRAVATDINERLKKYQGKKISELQMIELFESTQGQLGHMCNEMKLRWHYITMMDDQTRFTMAEVKAFPKEAGEALGKWIRTNETEKHAQEKKEMLANRRRLAEYCSTLLERVEDKLLRKLRPSKPKKRPTNVHDLLCSRLSKECPKAAGMAGLAGMDLSGLPPEVMAQLQAGNVKEL